MNTTRRTSRHTLRTVAVAALAASLVAGAVSGAQAASRKVLPGSIPQWTVKAKKLGKVKSSTPVDFRVYLEWNPGAAELAAAVSDPRSRQYGKFLTSAQFRSRFAPSADRLAHTAAWLRASGLTVTYSPANRHYLQVQGTAAQAGRAFGTTLGTYRYQGKTMVAARTALSVPSDVLGIAGVIGLDDTVELVRTHHVADAPPSPGFRNGNPTSAYWGEHRLSEAASPHGDPLPSATDYPYVVKGYTPAQLRSAYGISGLGVTGAGVTVAIIDAYASPTILQDANQYATSHGDPAFRPGQYRQLVAPGTLKRAVNKQHDPQGWWGEQTLDVEAVHAIAPDADILYVSAPNNYRDLDAAMNHVVDGHLASIVSNSYGYPYELLPKGFIKPLSDTFLQAAITGIGVYFSSGDDGDLSQITDGTPFPAWPASSPYVTAVGGTSLAVGADGSRLFETGWATGKSTLEAGPTWSAPFYLYGAGGGTSYLFGQPDYQADTVPAAMSGAHSTRPMRSIPDVSMLGDPTTGMLVGQTQAWSDGTYYDEYRIGGTSLACPLMAGMMALAQQVKGSAVGFANPTFYAMGYSGLRDIMDVSTALSAAGLTPADGAVVRVEFENGEDSRDGYVYSLRYLDYSVGQTIHTTTGYDQVTGIGAPNGAAFLAQFGWSPTRKHDAARG